VDITIEQRAERVLARVPDWIWNGETLPVPVEHIADSCFGLHVRDVDDLRSAPGVPDLPATQVLSGLLLPARGEIWVNAAEARDSKPRRRFTISHELGHWCLHSTGGAVWCRSQAVDPADVSAETRPAPPSGGSAAPRRAHRRDVYAETRPAYPPEESEANEFAAALLMPAHLVRRHYERLRRRDPEGTFRSLCAIFETSGAAMSRRLRRVI
jgi:IrrE N-terminal-like domain